MKNKNKKVIERNLGNNSTEASTIVKIAIGVIIVFVLIYLIFAVLTGEIKLKKDKKTEPTIQYVEILAETTFKQNSDDYFVLFYGFSGDDVNLLEGLFTKFRIRGIKWQQKIIKREKIPTEKK